MLHQHSSVDARVTTVSGALCRRTVRIGKHTQHITSSQFWPQSKSAASPVEAGKDIQTQPFFPYRGTCRHIPVPACFPKEIPEEPSALDSMSSPATPAERPAEKRSTSLGFLRRAKSNEPVRDRKTSGSLLGRRKASNPDQEELQRQQQAEVAARIPPKLPGYTPQPQIQSFGGESYQPRMATKYSMDKSNGNGAPPMPAIPAGYSEGPADPYARTESMTHRGRYSYASSAVSTLNSPRRVRRRKDPTPYK